MGRTGNFIKFKYISFCYKAEFTQLGLLLTVVGLEIWNKLLIIGNLSCRKKKKNRTFLINLPAKQFPNWPVPTLARWHHFTCFQHIISTHWAKGQVFSQAEACTKPCSGKEARQQISRL